MRVPLLDLSEQYLLLAEPIRQELDETLLTQNFILGPKVAEFERALADYCGNDEAESEKHKQHNPEQTSNETHAPTLTDWLPAVNDGNAASSADAA